MRTDLNSLMTLAHYFRRHYKLSMGHALKMAWGKAKGHEYVSITTRVSPDRTTLKRDFFFGADFDAVRKAAIAAGHAFAAEHRAGGFQVHSTEQHRLFQYAA